MSLSLPFLFDTTPHRLLDQGFGIGLTPEDLLTTVTTPTLFRDYYRPWRHLAATGRDIGSTIKSDKKMFTINLDVQHFAPEEITVKTVDGFVIIEGKHEEKRDEHGYVTRQFSRRYLLPDDCDAATVESKLSSDGVLTVNAPRVPLSLKNERSVPIAHTGPVRKEIRNAASQPESQAEENGTAK